MTKKKSSINNTPTLMRTPSHVKIYATNVRGGATNQDFRFELMNEKIRGENGEEIYVSDATLILSAVGAKRLLNRLTESIREYETDYGAIAEPKKEKYI